MIYDDYFSNANNDGTVVVMLIGLFLLAMALSIFGLHLLARSSKEKNKPHYTAVKVLSFLGIVMAPVVLLLLLALVAE